MLADGVGDFDEPSAVIEQFQQIRRGKILGAILRRIAKRLEQPRRNQRGNVMRLAIQHPTGLLRIEAGGQLTEQGQETVLIVFHTRAERLRFKNRTEFFKTNCIASIR
jgi:hypothetical protein